MAAPGPRFCPRCGTERIGDMRFCPNCGLDLAQVANGDPSPVEAAVPVDDTPAVPRPDHGRATVPRRPIWRPLLGPGLVVLLVVVAAAWVTGLGPFSPRGGSGTPAGGGASNPAPTSPFLPAVTAQPSFIPSAGLTAPPVGLTILSPADGAVVGAREVTVIGTAPAGLRITQDISFGFDRHATADGTGHWAIALELSEGDNELRFRIGDDPSTTQTLHVTYVPPAP
jgi:hypothetical protein